MNMLSNEISAVPGAGARVAIAAPELTVVIPTFKERGNIEQLVTRLRDVLAGHDWEVIFVDDDSPDGTAAVVRSLGEGDRRIRCIRRIGRRGLAGACIEGMLASQARLVAVMDADLQHDEALLGAMLKRFAADDVDLVVATRYQDGETSLGFNSTRARVSHWSTLVAQRLLGVTLSDPMSGFFMMQRAAFEELAPTLSPQGFKILLDIAATGRGRLRVAELPYEFRSRQHGESKLDGKVALDFVALLVAKLSRDTITYRFLLFCLVGLSGLAVHMAILQSALQIDALRFVWAQAAATVGAIAWNFILNNAFTYRDRRLTGTKFWTGLAGFELICAVGALSNIGVASLVFNTDSKWWVAGLLGALIGTVWNYVVSAVFVWRG